MVLYRRQVQTERKEQERLQAQEELQQESARKEEERKAKEEKERMEAQRNCAKLFQEWKTKRPSMTADVNNNASKGIQLWQ